MLALRLTALGSIYCVKFVELPRDWWTIVANVFAGENCQSLDECWYPLFIAIGSTTIVGLNAGVIVWISGWSTSGVEKLTADVYALSSPLLSLNLTCTEYVLSNSRVPLGTVKDVRLPVSPFIN